MSGGMSWSRRGGRGRATGRGGESRDQEMQILGGTLLTEASVAEAEEAGSHRTGSP